MRKKGGSLAESLDRTLEPRLLPGRPGRPRGSSNYNWTPEMDRIIAEQCAKIGPSKAKQLIQKQILKAPREPGEYRPRPDTVRKAVERRMSHLKLTTGQNRKRTESRGAKPWTQAEIRALLGALGGDLTDKSVEDRTHHTIKAARAKLARLNYSSQELRGIAFTVDELATMLQVTPRQVRRWKENGWLKTTRRRTSEQDLAAFLKEHYARVPFQALPREVQVFLISLGYPAPEAAEFQARVKSILEDVAGRKKRCDARPDDPQETRATAQARWATASPRTHGPEFADSA